MFCPIRDSFESIEEVQEALRKAGLESSNLVIGVDFTISNTTAGKHSFGGRSLHALDSSGSQPNPYQQVIRILGQTLSAFDDDNLIPAFGFGDQYTRDQRVFPFYEGRACNGFEEVLKRYEELLPTVKLGRPTSFAPLIRETIDIVREGGGYHILIIIADGQVTPDSEYCKADTETRRAIVEASNYAISIILVGVGDGPWDTMEEFDDGLPERKFDNFQFVNYHKEIAGKDERYATTNFAIAALQEIPQQFATIRKLGLL
jgi:E3 ubiquitin-protein ligase RGLG